MIKKTVTYTDYNGTSRTEDFYFNLSQAEVAEMQLTTDGGMDEKLKRIIDAKDVPTIISVFKDLVLRSYGVKSNDGRRFQKSQELRDAFEQSEPYSIIFMELATNADMAVEFVNGIIPKMSNIAPLPAPANPQ